MQQALHHPGDSSIRCTVNKRMPAIHETVIAGPHFDMKVVKDDDENAESSEDSRKLIGSANWALGP